jgi:hypothetical protein
MSKQPPLICTLPDAARWLTDRLNRVIGERDILDSILSNCVATDLWPDLKVNQQLNAVKNLTRVTTPSEPTILKATIHADVVAAKITKQLANLIFNQRDAYMSDKVLATQLMHSTHDDMTHRFGELPDEYFYSEYDRKLDLVPLTCYQVKDLFLSGETSISDVVVSELETLCILPFGTAITIDLESCRIYCDDLLALTEQMGAADDVGNTETKPNNKGSVIWWTDERITEAINMRDSRKASGAIDYTKQTADYFGVSIARLNTIIKEHNKRKAKPTSPAFSALDKK